MAHGLRSSTQVRSVKLRRRVHAGLNNRANSCRHFAHPSGHRVNSSTPPKLNYSMGLILIKLGKLLFLGLNQLMKQLQLLPKWVKKMPKVVGVQKIFARSTFKFTIIGQNLSQTRK